MSEEIKKISAFEAFAQVAKQTFAEAEEKAKQEAGSPRVERFRIGEDGEYTLRILPLAPSFDSEGRIMPMERKGYDYPLHQFFLAIKAPSKKGKTKKINIPVIRATDKEVGYSVDLIDTYLKIAKEIYYDDEELIKKISSTSYNGGLKWGFQHAMMILDVSSDKERAKGPMLWQASHSQYKDIDAAKMRLWAELKADGEQETCPISWLTDAYPVKIIRTNNNGKTEYKVEIGRKVLDVKEEEAEKLMDLPRIPEQIYRYTRYQFEATLEFLRQYDEEHDMNVCAEPDFIAAMEQLKGELPADDKSHFDLTGASSKGGDKDEVTLDSLYAEYDAIVDQDLSEKSEEYQELRERIRQFIEDKELDVRISRTKNNAQLLEEIEEALEESAKTPKKEPVEEKPKAVTRMPRPKKMVEEDEVAEEVDDTPETDVPHRARPIEEDEDVKVEKDSEPETPIESEPVEEAPRRRLHSRRPMR